MEQYSDTEKNGVEVATILYLNASNDACLSSVGDYTGPKIIAMKH